MRIRRVRVLLVRHGRWSVGDQRAPEVLTPGRRQTSLAGFLKVLNVDGNRLVVGWMPSNETTFDKDGRLDPGVDPQERALEVLRRLYEVEVLDEASAHGRDDASDGGLLVARREAYRHGVPVTRLGRDERGEDSRLPGAPHLARLRTARNRL